MRVKVDVMGRFARMWKTGVVVAALVVTAVACGSSDDSRERNAALVAGTACTKPGEAAKISKVSVVCAQTSTGKIWYQTMKAQGRAVSCSKAGAVRKKKSVVWVCEVAKGKKVWRATSPLPPAVLQAAAVVEPGASQPLPVLESTNVASPSQPVVADGNVLADPAIADEPPVIAPSTVVSAPVTIATVPQSTTSTSTSTTTTTTIPKTSSTTASVSYKVGDTGPGGGIIFYKDLARPVGSQYFEAACAGWSDGICGGDDIADPRPAWGCRGVALSGADGSAIGDGKQNTADIVKECKEARIAASLADDLVLGSQSDWFLPSKDELNQMYLQKTTVGGLASSAYWSSTEFSRESELAAVYQVFSNGAHSALLKSSWSRVRPVRSF
jgi:hypothetical protein